MTFLKHAAATLAAMALGFSITIAPLSAQGARAAADPKATTAIVGGYLIDGQDHPPVPDSVVLIKGKQIVAVGTRTTVKIPPGTKVINAAGYTVMPGLFNTHVHLDFLGHADYVEWHKAHTPYDPKSDAISIVAAKQLLMGGVTTAVDLGGLPETVVKIRDGINRGQIVGPRMLVSCGWIWTAAPEVEAANHRGMFSHDHPNYLFNVHTPEEARKAVLKTIEMGADIIKVSAGEAGAAEKGLRPEAVKVIAEEAHRKHLLVTGHSHGDDDTLARIANGQDGIEHTSFNVDNPEMIRGFLAHKTVVDPTPITQIAGRDAVDWPAWRDDPRARLLTPTALWSEVRASIDDPAHVPYFRGAFQPGSYERQAHVVKTLHDAKVRMVLGTDSGTPANFHVDSTWRQMALYVRDGIPPMDVIAMATRVPAEWLGLGEKTGTIEAGRLADIIVVDGNPLTNMEALKDLVVVMKEGVQYKGAATTDQRPRTTTHTNGAGPQ
jgi:imidazolonepropionase-like amidohydrolase